MKSEYFLIEPLYKRYNSREIYAEVIPFPSDYDIQIALLAPTPINNLHKITFSFFEKEPPLLDYLLTDGSYVLISRRLVACFQDMSVLFTSYPVRIIGNVTRKEMNLDYSLFHPLEVLEAVDWNRSDIPQKSIKINKVILRQEIIQQAKPLIRLADLGGYLLVHKVLKEEMQSRGLTGCGFRNLDSFSSWKGLDTSTIDKIIQQNNIDFHRRSHDN